MITSLSTAELCRYVCAQLNQLYPDGSMVQEEAVMPAVGEALERIEYCFEAVNRPAYRTESGPKFNHLYSDHYLMFLWWLSRVLFFRESRRVVLDKIYCLNKSFHGFDCVYSNDLPSRFLVIHGVGTVLGRAHYADYLVVHQGCTVGQSGGEYPTLEAGVGLGVGAAVLGAARVGTGASIGAGLTIVGGEIPAGAAAWRSKDGAIAVHTNHRHSIARDYFDY